MPGTKNIEEKEDEKEVVKPKEEEVKPKSRFSDNTKVLMKKLRNGETLKEGDLN